MKRLDSGKQDLRVADEAETKDQHVAGAGPVDEVARARLQKRLEAERRRRAAVLGFKSGLSPEELEASLRLLTPDELEEAEFHGF
jgi:hypothetical protein